MNNSWEMITFSIAGEACKQAGQECFPIPFGFSCPLTYFCNFATRIGGEELSGVFHFLLTLSYRMLGSHVGWSTLWGAWWWLRGRGTRRPASTWSSGGILCIYLHLLECLLCLGRSSTLLRDQAGSHQQQLGRTSCSLQESWSWRGLLTGMGWCLISGV